MSAPDLEPKGPAEAAPQSSPDVSAEAGVAPAPLSAAQVLALQKTAGNTSVTRWLARERAGEPLDGSLRARLEPAFGRELGDVRVREDASATAAAGAAAFARGHYVTIDPAQRANDALLAHEVAHVVQQTSPGGLSASESALEADASRAAVAALAPGRGRFLPRLRAALSLQACPTREVERADLGRRLLAEQDPRRLEAALREASEADLRSAGEHVPAGSVHADALAWERAVRGSDYARVAQLAESSDAQFREAYADRIRQAILVGRTTITIDRTNRQFADFIETTFQRLLGIPSGFRLVVQLLATRQPVRLRPAAAGAGHETSPDNATEARLQTQYPDDAGENAGLALPPSQQRRRRGSGSTVNLDMSTIENEVSIGSARGRPRIIDMDPTATIGHELIHALHNARGENISSGVGVGTVRGMGGVFGAVRDPLTGEEESPEELRTITGQTRFQPAGGAASPSFPTEFNVPAGITENDLRRDLGLDPRGAHFGGRGTATIPRRGAQTVDDLVARYRLGGGALPAEVAAIVRAMLVERRLGELLPLMATDATVPVPHPDDVRLRVRFVERRGALADRLQGLTVQ